MDAEQLGADQVKNRKDRGARVSDLPGGHSACIVDLCVENSYDADDNL